MPSNKGKFIVIDGIDGSGKATQTKLLSETLSKLGYAIERIDFPQYGTKPAGLVEEYLNGKYGPSEEVGPYRGSIFYACDRYDASFKIRKWLDEGKIVISDRYVSSNMGHQGGKIKDEKEWEEYIDWDYNLEYNIFGIPKPDITFILKTSSDYSIRLSNTTVDMEKQDKRNAYLGDYTKQDIHERDKNHLINALDSYVRIANKYKDEFKIIECLENESLLPVNIIHQKVLKEVLKIIQSDMVVLQNAGKFRILSIMAGLNGENPLQLIEVAGRTAYQSRDKITDESASKFVEMLRKRGHESVLEHSCMTVEFNDVSRGFTHELVRHRLVAYTQESTRYVDESNFRVIAPPNKDLNKKLVNLSLPNGNSVEVSFNDWMNLNEQMYRGLRNAEWVPQDARQVLPNAIKAQIVATANFREWRHIFKMRCDMAAHWEIRDVMVDLLKEVKQKVPVIFDDFEIVENNGVKSAIIRK